MTAASVDRCECGAPADDIHFDRSICACGMAHYYCNQCGTQTEACGDESPAAKVCTSAGLRYTRGVIRAAIGIILAVYLYDVTMSASAHRDWTILILLVFSTLAAMAWAVRDVRRSRR